MSADGLKEKLEREAYCGGLEGLIRTHNQFRPDCAMCSAYFNVAHRVARAVVEWDAEILKDMQAYFRNKDACVAVQAELRARAEKELGK